MELIEKLADVLKRNAELYEELAFKSIDERDAIESKGLENLALITSEKESIVHALRGVEEKRNSIVAEAASMLGLEPKVTLKELVNHPSVLDQKQRLLVISERLRDAVENNDKLNEFNRILLASSVDFVRKSISFAARVGEESATYVGSKMVDVQIPSGSMVRKAL